MTVERTGRGREIETGKGETPARAKGKATSPGRNADNPEFACRTALAEEIVHDDREVSRALAKGTRDTAT